MGFLATLLGFAPTVLSLTQQIVAWQEKKINAQTEQQRIEADERIKMLEAKRNVLIAESSTPWNSIVRAWLVLPPSIYVAKLFVWDKVLGWGSTDPLSSILEWIVVIVYGFYFMADVTRMLKR